MNTISHATYRVMTPMKTLCVACDCWLAASSHRRLAFGF